MVPIDEFNRFTIAADANKLLVPTYPKRKADETQVDYDTVFRRKYYDVSSISGIFKSFGDAPNGASEELQEIQWSLGAEYTYMISSHSVLVTTTKARTKVTASTSLSVQASR